MKDTLIKIRNRVSHFVYIHVYKRFFFYFDPEKVHNTCTRLGIILGLNPLTRFVSRLLFNYSIPMLEQKIHGITFKNQIGISSWFDKD